MSQQMLTPDVARTAQVVVVDESAKCRQRKRMSTHHMPSGQIDTSASAFDLAFSAVCHSVCASIRTPESANGNASSSRTSQHRRWQVATRARASVGAALGQPGSGCVPPGRTYVHGRQVPADTYGLAMYTPYSSSYETERPTPPGPSPTMRPHSGRRTRLCHIVRAPRGPCLPSCRYYQCDPVHQCCPRHATVSSRPLLLPASTRDQMDVAR